MDSYSIISHLFIGAPQSGKTQLLAQQARAYAGQVTESSDSNSGTQASVLFLCKDQTTAQHARTFMENSDVRVASWQEIALEIMAEPAARQRFHREPRLLEPYEEKFLAEDLKIIEVKKHHRMEKVLYYLFGGFANLTENTGEDLETSYTWEEQNIMDQLFECLEFTGGIHPYELANYAYKTIMSSEDTLRNHQYAAVFVDDYGQLCRAAQRMVCALATRQISVAATSTALLVESEAYPCPAGTAEFLELFPETQVTELSESFQQSEAAYVVARFASDAALSTALHDKGLGLPPVPPDEKPVIYMEQGMGEELRAIAKESAAALSAGKSVMVVGTDRIWRKNLIVNFKKAGLPVMAAPQSGISLGRDFTSKPAYESALRDTTAKLLKNPEDSVAWRSMLGYGDYLANSAALDTLRKALKGSGLRLYEALEQLLNAGAIEGYSTSAPSIVQLVSRYKECQDYLCGLQSVEPDGAAPLEAGANTAKPKLCIEVCTPAQAIELRADVVVFGGCITGFIPCAAYSDISQLAGKARQRERTRCLQTLYTVAACARERMVFTGFTSCSLETAENLGLHIVKTGLHGGIRMATTEPCEFLDILR